jgi:hypothetical protein
MSSTGDSIAGVIAATAAPLGKPSDGELLVDPSLKRPDRQYTVIGLSEQDISNIGVLARHEPHVRNNAVRIRRCVAREARRMLADERKHREEERRQRTLGEKLDEVLACEDPE